ncbi:MAG TPA: RHS repeat-associated core domain-containing protein [Dokdonella sp.]|uniref:RHS repeat-associated core domain-containing protein n=1 Tax=Dokdonella sp. TaxID=2291710 RepID=UPI002D7F84F9|nr:RHS repeat-associated core domain-containing protein [Dokdonella sp.]HET9033057.1 RHS repeat-associated core domain-containing protein [Dokdonella sp.]
MTRRIYDPNLGRFLQADPFIQAPGNSQSLNRYSYVFNNPMAYTDPIGYWGAREQAGLRTVVAIAITCVTGYYAGADLSAGGASAASNAAAISFAGGFAAGAVQSGNLRGAVVGGISSLAFFGVAQKFSVRGVNIASGDGIAAYSKLALASGVTGGVMAELQGGRFGNGFVTAGASAFLSPIPEAASSNPAGQTVVAAVIGGTVSRATGGKFANGAITSAFQFAMGRAVARSDASNEGGADQGDDFYANLRLKPRVVTTSVDGNKTLDFGVTTFAWDPAIPNELAEWYISTAVSGWNTTVSDGQTTYTAKIRVVLIGHIDSLANSNTDFYLTNCVPSACTYGLGAADPGGRNLYYSSTGYPDTPVHEFGHIFGFVKNRAAGLNSIMSNDRPRYITPSDISILYDGYSGGH